MGAPGLIAPESPPRLLLWLCVNSVGALLTLVSAHWAHLEPRGSEGPASGGPGRKQMAAVGPVRPWPGGLGAWGQVAFSLCRAASVT